MHVYAALSDRLLTVDDVTQPSIDEYAFGSEIQALAASPDRPKRLFVGTAADGLRRSVDGDTFEDCGGFTDRITAVTVSPHNPAEIWVGTEPSAVYRSTDGGESFTACSDLTTLPSADRWSFPPRPGTHHVRWIEIDPEKPARASVAIEAGAFLRTTDAGETWIDHPSGARRDTHTIATHSEAPERLYVAAGDGYAESTDRGDNWETPQDGLDHRYVWGLAVDTTDPDLVVVSSASGARTAHSSSRAESYLYRRERGDDWERAMTGLPDPTGTTRAVLDAGEPGEFFALTNRGLFRSTDRALSWQRVDIPWLDRYRDAAARGLVVLR